MQTWDEGSNIATEIPLLYISKEFLVTLHTLNLRQVGSDRGKS
jgi:hypothetical protein